MSTQDVVEETSLMVNNNPVPVGLILKVNDRIMHERTLGRRGVDRLWGADQLKQVMILKGRHPKELIEESANNEKSLEHKEMLDLIFRDFRTQAQLEILKVLNNNLEKNNLIQELSNKLKGCQYLPIVYGTSGTEFNGKEIIQTQGLINNINNPYVQGIYFIDTNSHPLRDSVNAEAFQASLLYGIPQDITLELLTNLYFDGNIELMNLTGDNVSAPTLNMVNRYIKECEKNNIKSKSEIALCMQLTSEYLEKRLLESNKPSTLGDWKVIFQGSLVLLQELNSKSEEWNPIINSSWSIIEDFSIKLSQQNADILKDENNGLNEILEKRHQIFNLIKYVELFKTYYLNGYFDYLRSSDPKFANYSENDFGPIKIWNLTVSNLEQNEYYECEIYIQLDENNLITFSLCKNKESLCKIKLNLTSENILEYRGEEYLLEQLNNALNTSTANLNGNNGGKGYYMHFLHLSHYINLGVLFDDYENPNTYAPILDAIIKDNLKGLIPLAVGRTWVIPENQTCIDGKGNIDKDSTLGSAISTIWMLQNLNNQQWNDLTKAENQPEPSHTRTIGISNNKTQIISGDNLFLSNLPPNVIKEIDNLRINGNLQRFKLKGELVLIAQLLLIRTSTDKNQPNDDTTLKDSINLFSNKGRAINIDPELIKAIKDPNKSKISLTPKEHFQNFDRRLIISFYNNIKTRYSSLINELKDVLNPELRTNILLNHFQNTYMLFDTEILILLKDIFNLGEYFFYQKNINENKLNFVQEEETSLRVKIFGECATNYPTSLCNEILRGAEVKGGNNRFKVIERLFSYTTGSLIYSEV